MTIPITPDPTEPGPPVLFDLQEQPTLDSLQTLQSLLAGTGPALTTHDPGDHPALAAASLPPGTVVLPTSGSTGRPKLVHLDGAALRASAQATLDQLGGPGHWLLAMTPRHIAGFQVWCRSALAGRLPEIVHGPFRVAAFAAAAARLDPELPAYTALVPTQLRRLLADPEGVTALQRFAGVLVGGAALDEHEFARAQSLGMRLVRTYGASETGGGCVYEGVPLPGVRIRLDAQERIHLSGPMLARGYLGDDRADAQAFTIDPDGTRWYRTNDRGAVHPDGRLEVLGRLDQTILTGGHKVDPADVERALSAVWPDAPAAVVPRTDPDWGQQVVAVLALPGAETGPLPEPALAAVRDRLRGHLPDHALPHAVLVLSDLPMLPTGKPDRVRMQAAVQALPGDTM